MAERERFELSVGFNTYGGLANHCFRPLSHLSAAADKVLGLIGTCKKKLGQLGFRMPNHGFGQITESTLEENRSTPLQ
jgi:hypothetical protein